MFNRLKSGDRNALSIGVIVLVVVFFVSLNILAAGLFKSVRLDLTADSLFTLSQGTKDLLVSIDEPIELRYYNSQDLEVLGPLYTSHAGRVGDLLDDYARLSNGMIRVERFDPEPFSPEEDLAVADGLRGISIDTDGSQVFFGLAGVNSTDDRSSIPLLAPERGNFLEYDLTRLLYDLAHPEKPKVAVLGSVPLRGDQFNQFRQWAVLEPMQQIFELEFEGGEVTRIDDDVEILLLAQPQGLTEMTLYAIDQFVMRGGRVLAFIDPLVEAQQTGRPGAPQEGAAAGLEPLLAAWGVELSDDRVVGDGVFATRVQTRHQGREVITDYVVWLGLRSESFEREDVVSAYLQQINLRTAGAITLREGATTELRPLMVSTDQAMLIDKARVEVAPDPVGLINDFAPTGEIYTLAARVTGPVKSAFPDGPPEAVEDKTFRAAHLNESKAPLNLILVADADILADRNWVQRQNLLGQSFAVPVANNGDFAVSALDNLAGAEGLIALRARGLTVRPFEILEDMARDAEAKFRTKEQELLAKIDETREKIRELQQGEQGSGAILTAAQQAAVDDFRAEMLDLRAELREVQHALRKDVESIGAQVRAFNIWVVPAAVGVLALVLALLRRIRAARFQAMPRQGAMKT